METGRASERRIAELEGNLAEEKVCVAQLKANYNSLKNEYDNLRSQSQFEIQDLSNSINQLNFQMSTAKASAVEEYKTSAEFANIIDEEFWGATKVKALMENHYPYLDYSFLENDEDED